MAYKLADKYSEWTELGDVELLVCFLNSYNYLAYNHKKNFLDKKACIIISACFIAQEEKPGSASGHFLDIVLQKQ